MCHILLFVHLPLKYHFEDTRQKPTERLTRQKHISVPFFIKALHRVTRPGLDPESLVFEIGPISLRVQS